MELHQHRIDGHVDVTELRLSDVAASKRTALGLVANPLESGVYRIRFVDGEYERTAWDTHNLPETPRLGALMFAGAS